MITAVVLAAGASTRMGNENKLLLPLADTNVITTTVTNVVNSSVDKTIVVLGHERNEIMSALSHLDVDVVYNASHQQGMTTSIKAAIAKADEGSTAFMICLSDMPLIETADYDALIDYYRNQLVHIERPIVRPQYKDSVGHPVLFHSSYRDGLLDANSNNGCREVISQNKAQLRLFEASDIRFFFDVDTPKDYKRLIRYMK